MEIKRHDKGKYWLREQLASGDTASGEEFSIGLNMGSGSLIFTFPEATYAVTLRAIMGEVMDFREASKGKDGEEDDS